MRGDSTGDSDRREGEQEGRSNGEVETCAPPLMMSAEEERELQPSGTCGEELRTGG